MLSNFALRFKSSLTVAPDHQHELYDAAIREQNLTGSSNNERRQAGQQTRSNSQSLSKPLSGFFAGSVDEATTSFCTWPVP